jgi:hypothetical protein
MVIMGETPILCRVTQYFDRYGMVQRRSTSDHPKSYSVTRLTHRPPKRIPQRTLSACEPHGIFSSQVTTSDLLNVYPKNAVCLRTSKAIGPHAGSLKILSFALLSFSSIGPMLSSDSKDSSIFLHTWCSGTHGASLCCRLFQSKWRLVRKNG